MKYRKKPVVIEAYQTDKELDIETLEGTMHASVGDYIITGVRGEQYPCKPDIFEQTYEPADAPTASPWHRVEEELPKDDCEVFTASRLPFDETDTWLYEHSFFTTDVSECEELKDEYPNEHKAAFYKWSDISDKYVICHYGLKYWMPIEPPKEDA